MSIVGVAEISLRAKISAPGRIEVQIRDFYFIKPLKPNGYVN